MVARTLVEKDIEGGSRLLDELDRQKDMEVSSALWFYLEDSDEYRLLLASRLVDEKGPLAAYTVVQDALSKVPEGVRPSFTDISVVSPSDDRLRAIASAVKTGSGIQRIRFSRNVVDGIYIEDALIYRLN
jgi:hypothetical protein